MALTRRKKTKRPALPCDPVIQPRGSRAIKGLVEEGPLTPFEWHRNAFQRTVYREELHGERISMNNAQVHHVISKHWLRTNGHHNRVWDDRNAMVLATTDHERHESAFQRIPRDRIREATWEFARELGVNAVLFIERMYPETPEGDK